ncbi:MAG: hypothetical protein B6I20_11780 [Bacteroidetes bacterium 4572_117]|nr:MAG: hypothetical protein B6I20_11780 [Bacteroidetes bacterium 4572_117]
MTNKIDMEKNIIGIYNDEMLVAPAINQLRDKNVEVQDVYTPFPVFEIIEAMKLKTRFPYFAFAFGVIGFSLTFWFMYWTAVESYPLNIGGKPSLSLSFVVILFVMVINITVISSLIAFFIRVKKGPGSKAKYVADGINDDKFVVLINKTKTMTDDDSAKISEILRDSGAVDVQEN